MPWKGLRPDTAGGRRSRRLSSLDKGAPAAPEKRLKPDSVESKSQPPEASKSQSASRPSSRDASPGRPPTVQETPDADHSRIDVPQQLRRKEASKIPKSHRFSLLRFRHASDPQLSRSYASSASLSTPPLPNPASTYLILEELQYHQELTFNSCL